MPMVHSNRRLHHRMKSVCRLPACLAWPHGLFGSWLFCICALLGFFEFLYHLSSCGAKTMNAHGVFSLKIQSHTKPAHSDCRGQIPVPGYIRRKSFSHFCEETGRAQQQCIWEAAQGRREARRENSASSGLEGMRIHSGVSFGSSLVGLHKIYSSLKCRI